MTTPSVSSVYRHVVEDVISKVKDEFLNVGVGEDVLNELQGLWEMKMMQYGAISGAVERLPAPKSSAGQVTTVHDLNVPYEGTEEYETPTAEMLFPPTPLQTPVPTPLPGNIEQSLYHLPTPAGTSEYGGMQDARITNEVKPGRPTPYMQPPSPWMSQRPLGVDVNVAYVEGRDEVETAVPHQPAMQDFFMMSSGKRKRDDGAPQFTGGYIPQQDGPADSASDFFNLEIYRGQGSVNGNRVNANGELRAIQDAEATPSVPPQNAIHNGLDDLFRYPPAANEGYGAPACPDAQTLSSIIQVPSHVVEDEEPSLNEDDDDDLDDLDQGDNEPETHNLILAQFDKVTRTKSRWKCTLKDGIMHINGKDILFTKATGEFDF